MASRAQLLDLVRSGLSYEEIGARVGMSPGLAYLVVTGLPADGSDVLAAEELAGREGLLPGSSQHLANPGTELPKHQATVEAWMRARAGADEPMQAAAAARDAEPPPIAGEDETDDVITILGREHNQVKYLQEELQAIPGVRAGGSEAQQRQRRSIVDLITVRLSAHEPAEEGHLWPAVRTLLADGDQLADEALSQEQQGKDLLHEMGGLDGTEDRFDELVEQLALALRLHVAFEDKVFLALNEATSDEQRTTLGRAIRDAEADAPTRPHPHAPDKGTAARAAAKAAAPLDHTRDALRGRPADSKGQKDTGGAT